MARISYARDGGTAGSEIAEIDLSSQSGRGSCFVGRPSVRFAFAEGMHEEWRPRCAAR
jgi:hypothetical protein